MARRPSTLRLAFQQFWFLFGGVWLLVGSIFAVVGLGILVAQLAGPGGRTGREPLPEAEESGGWERGDDSDAADDFWIGVIFSGVGTLIGGVGGVLFARGLNRARTIARLLDSGVRVTGTVIEVRPTNVRINRVQQWQLRYSYQDYTGRVHEATSEYMPPAQAQQWRQGDQGTVCYDDRSPEVSYWFGRDFVG